MRAGSCVVPEGGAQSCSRRCLVDWQPVRGAFVAFLCVCTSVPALSWGQYRQYRQSVRLRDALVLTTLVGRRSWSLRGVAGARDVREHALGNALAVRPVARQHSPCGEFRSRARAVLADLSARLAGRAQVALPWSFNGWTPETSNSDRTWFFHSDDFIFYGKGLTHQACNSYCSCSHTFPSLCSPRRGSATMGRSGLPDALPTPRMHATAWLRGAVR
jgi:hypothetical protein